MGVRLVCTKLCILLQALGMVAALVADVVIFGLQPEPARWSEQGSNPGLRL